VKKEILTSSFQPVASKQNYCSELLIKAICVPSKYISADATGNLNKVWLNNGNPHV
jgi:hypothetical protein